MGRYAVRLSLTNLSKTGYLGNDKSAIGIDELAYNNEKIAESRDIGLLATFLFCAKLVPYHH